MRYGGRYKPSKAAARKFTQKMDEIRQFCAANGIDMSASGDSYYFTIDGQKYRVSNHSVEASNANACNWCGEQVRDVYHPNGREVGTIYIHAGKTRIMEIYNDLEAGYKLDGRGNRR